MYVHMHIPQLFFNVGRGSGLYGPHEVLVAYIYSYVQNLPITYIS
jgi:hypothetical protein